MDFIMKTLRYRIGNEVKPGILDQEGNIRDVSSLVQDWDNKNVTISKLNEVKKIDPKNKIRFERHAIKPKRVVHKVILKEN